MSMLLDALEWAGDTLDKPGRAVRGLLGGRPEELLATVPFSDSLGFTNKANRVSGQDLTGLDDGSLLSTIGNIGAEVALDPLMFAGAGLGRMLGRGASEAAVARGPRYATSEDDIQRMFTEAGGGVEKTSLGMTEAQGRAMPHIREITQGDNAGRLMSEIHPESTLLGAGWEGVAFKQPDGTVLRLGQQAAGPGRPIADGVLTPNSSLDVAKLNRFDDEGNSLAQAVASGNVNRVERMPFADNVGNDSFWRSRNPETMLTPGDDLRQTLKNSGLEYHDPHVGNVGTIGGRPVVIDPGAVRPADVQKLKQQQYDEWKYRVDNESPLYRNGPPEPPPVFDHPPSFSGPYSPVTEARDPSRLMNMLLDGVGSDDAVRRAYASGLAGPDFRRKLGAFGAAGGADAGVLARMLSGD